MYLVKFIYILLDCAKHLSLYYVFRFNCKVLSKSDSKEPSLMGSVYHLCSCSGSFHVKCTHRSLIFEKCALDFRSPKRPSYLTT